MILSAWKANRYDISDDRGWADVVLNGELWYWTAHVWVVNKDATTDQSHVNKTFYGTNKTAEEARDEADRHLNTSARLTTTGEHHD